MTRSSMSAKPRPCSTPPSTWLRACSGAITRPMSCTATMRSTVISPVAHIDRDLRDLAAERVHAHAVGIRAARARADELRLAELARDLDDRLAQRAVQRDERAVDDAAGRRARPRRRRPRARAACRAGRRPPSAPRARPTASSASRPRPARRRRSASSRPRRARDRAAARAPRRRPARTPSSRPVPMSCAPVTTVTTPSWPMRTSACAGGPPPPHQIWQAAPRPRLRPSGCSRSRSASRSAQPASSAARSMQAARFLAV